jgi:hypothetical protein
MKEGTRVVVAQGDSQFGQWANRVSSNSDIGQPYRGHTGHDGSQSDLQGVGVGVVSGPGLGGRELERVCGVALGTRAITLFFLGCQALTPGRWLPLQVPLPAAQGAS